jgi:hypothetical protein
MQGRKMVRCCSPWVAGEVEETEEAAGDGEEDVAV